MSSVAPRSALHVGSEVGTLGRVLLHRPGLELRRITPSNKAELLFDDVLWEQVSEAAAALAGDAGTRVVAA